MQCIAVVLATIVIVPVSGDSSCSKTGNCKELACGPLEVPVSGKPRYDHFCRPLFTPPWELRKLRRCVCKRRYLRNSWGECIPRLKCIPCQFRWQKDYRECADGCPATCNFPFKKSCDKPCAPGCACPPGWVVHPRKPWKCIKSYGCLPKCPTHSEFQACVSSCLPKCGRVTPEKCEVNCNRGACVCKKGYIGLEEKGKLTCVSDVVCSWITRSKPSFKPIAVTHSNVTGGTLTSTSTLSGIVGQPANATTTAVTGSLSGSQVHPVETPSIGVVSHGTGIVSTGIHGGATGSGVSGTIIGSSASTQGGDTVGGASGVNEGSNAGIHSGVTGNGISGITEGSSGRTQGEGALHGTSGITGESSTGVDGGGSVNDGSGTNGGSADMTAGPQSGPASLQGESPSIEGTIRGSSSTSAVSGVAEGAKPI